jgi:hypothetical protein
MFFINKKILPKDQNNSRFPLYLFNRESECHEESVPRVECIFQHTLKMSPRSSKNCIHNRVTGLLSRPPN